MKTLNSNGEAGGVRQHHPGDPVGVRVGGQGQQRRGASHDDQGTFNFND